MMKDYFVMLTLQHGGITPMMEDEYTVATFDTLEEAAEVAEQNVLGQFFGYEVFAVGCGESV